ncbi:MAG: glycosyltransferase family A protein [Gemmatimonadota bacterium]
MSDVTAVVLSVGEPFVQRALGSIAAQTVPVHETIVIENVSPYSRAANEGARRVVTPFFIYVDADMILDEDCVERLLGRMRDDTGIVVAELRDPLCGQVVGIRLLRTECFRVAQKPDSIAPETDFVALVQRFGWHTVYVEDPSAERGAARPTVGEHRPDYTPSYTLRKFVLEGARIRYRGARSGLFTWMGDLEGNRHPQSLLAQLALGYGVFASFTQDELKPSSVDPRAEELANWLVGDGTAVLPGLLPLQRHERLRDVYRAFLAAGKCVAQNRAGATLRDIIAQSTGAGHDWRALVAKVALGRGVLMDARDGAGATRDEAMLGRFIRLSLRSQAGWRELLRAQVVDIARGGLRHRANVEW